MDTVRKPRIRGADERQIYKNFIKDYPRNEFEVYMDKVFNTCTLKTKDDQKSLKLRLTANDLYIKGTSPSDCIRHYNKSLRYALYNKTNYALAIANRSLMLFKLFQFQKCIEDIDLCLKAEYPKELKPKVYLRKCECYWHLGNGVKVKETAIELLSFLDSNSQIFESCGEKYKEKAGFYLSRANEMIRSSKGWIVVKKSTCEDVPIAANVTYVKKDKWDSVLASEDIKKGQILFIEEVYAFSPEKRQKQFCQYCLKSIDTGIPCIFCVKYMFCTEVCRNAAWSEFHQWECFAVQTKFIDGLLEMHLALRIIFKTYNKSPLDTNADQYSTIYHFEPVFNNKFLLQLHAENAMILVHYLKLKTDFFFYLKRWRGFTNKSDKDLMITIGALLIRHASQMQYKRLSVEIYSDQSFNENATAFAICPALAQMTHSCDPNVVYYFCGNSVVVKALKDVEANTKLTYAYRDINYLKHPRDERHELLWEFCQLRCKCLPCLNPLLNLEAKNSYLCIKCNGPAIPTNPRVTFPQLECLNCNSTYTMPEEIDIQLSFVMLQLERFFSFDIVQCAKEALIVMKTILNRQHHVFQILYEKMAVVQFMNGDIESALVSIKSLAEQGEGTRGPITIDNVKNQLSYCTTVFRCLTGINAISNESFRNGLKSVEVSLEKTEKLCTLLQPSLLGYVNLLKLQHFCLQFLFEIKVHNGE